MESNRWRMKYIGDGKINIAVSEFDIGRFYCVPPKSTESFRHIQYQFNRVIKYFVN